MLIGIENLEEKIKKINTLWLAEKNLNYFKPKFENTTEGQSYRLTSPNNLKFQCKIEKTLSF